MNSVVEMIVSHTWPLLPTHDRQEFNCVIILRNVDLLQHGVTLPTSSSPAFYQRTGAAKPRSLFPASAAVGTGWPHRVEKQLLMCIEWLR